MSSFLITSVRDLLKSRYVKSIVRITIIKFISLETLYSLYFKYYNYLKMFVFVCVYFVYMYTKK